MAYSELWGACVTPFNDRDEIDYEVLGQILRLYEKSHEGLLIAGSTGEGQSLSQRERKSLLEYTLKNFSNRVVMGLKNGSLAEVMRELKGYGGLSPHAYLISLPAYYKAPDDGIYLYFETIFRKYKNWKFILYNIPSRTGSMLSLSVYEKLKRNFPNLIALKDSSLNLDFVKKASELGPLFCGSDDMALDYLKAGAKAFISVGSIFYSESFHDLYSEYINGFHDLILYGYIRYITNLMSQKVNPIGIKELYKLKGYKSMNLRLPLTPYDGQQREKLMKILPAHETKIERALKEE